MRRTGPPQGLPAPAWPGWTNGQRGTTLPPEQTAPGSSAGGLDHGNAGRGRFRTISGRLPGHLATGAEAPGIKRASPRQRGRRRVSGLCLWGAGARRRRARLSWPGRRLSSGPDFPLAIWWWDGDTVAAPWAHVIASTGPKSPSVGASACSYSLLSALIRAVARQPAAEQKQDPTVRGEPRWLSSSGKVLCACRRSSAR